MATLSEISARLEARAATKGAREAGRTVEATMGELRRLSVSTSLSAKIEEVRQQLLLELTARETATALAEILSRLDREA